MVPLGLIAGAVACVIEALATGGAHAGFFLVFPFVTGGSGWLVAGALLGFAGIASIGLLLPDADIADRPPLGETPARSASGGLVVIGPVPIFWGGWRSPPGWAYWSAAAVGGALLAAFFVALVWR